MSYWIDRSMPFPSDLSVFYHHPSSFESQNQFFICFLPYRSPFSLHHFPFLCLVSLQYWIWPELFQQLHFPSISNLLYRPNLNIFLRSLYSGFFSFILRVYGQSRKAWITSCRLAYLLHPYLLSLLTKTGHQNSLGNQLCYSQSIRKKLCKIPWET